jgi:hypothetical protein
VEESLPWEESKNEDYEIINKEKYKVSSGEIYSGQMRAES